MGNMTMPAAECMDDMTWTDTGGDDCNWYTFNADSCGSYGEGAFSACCECGGGMYENMINMGNKTRRNMGEVCQDEMYWH